jgi:hypothetical protein
MSDDPDYETQYMLRLKSNYVKIAQGQVFPTEEKAKEKLSQWPFHFEREIIPILVPVPEHPEIIKAKSLKPGDLFTYEIDDPDATRGKVYAFTRIDYLGDDEMIMGYYVDAIHHGELRVTSFARLREGQVRLIKFAICEEDWQQARSKGEK